MNKKSIISLFAAAVLCAFSFVACTSHSVSSDTTSSSSSTAAPTTISTDTPISNTTTSTQSTTTTNTTGVQTESTTRNTVVQGAVGDKQHAVAKLAKSLIGSEFKYGAAGPVSFDNSGFLVYCYAQNGVNLPRLTRDIVKQGVAVDKSVLMPGDIVFFYNETPGAAEYAGIYIGDNQFVASNTEEKPVSIHSMTVTYFADRFICARRYL